MTDLLIIGGSDAGISAALRAKAIEPNIRPTLVVADRYPNFSICGLPFFLSGEVKRWQDLSHRSVKELEQKGINLLLAHQATSIHPNERFASVEDSQGRILQLNYDKLIVATGAQPMVPPIQGIEQAGVFTLRWMDDSLAFNTYLDEHAPERIAIIGGGYVGLEMADAMTLRGLEVTLIESGEGILTTFDHDLGFHIQRFLKDNRVDVRTHLEVQSIERKGVNLQLNGNNGFSHATDMVLVATGSRPQSTLAQACGIKTGVHNAICVTRKMETSLPGIYAAGDCTETWHRLLATGTYLPLGSTPCHIWMLR